MKRALAALGVLALGVVPTAGAAGKQSSSPLTQAKTLFATDATAQPVLLKLRAATPAQVARATGRRTAAAVSAERCWYTEWKHDRGVFPYWRGVYQGTYWCAIYGSHITYRTSNTWTRVNGVCSQNGAVGQWKVVGGAGYSYVVVHSEASFSCRTPWWFPLNDNLWMEPAFNAWGNTSMSRYG